MEKEFQILEQGPKAEIYLDSFKAKRKKIPNFRTPGFDGIHGFWFKNSHPSMTDWQPK